MGRSGKNWYYDFCTCGYKVMVKCFKKISKIFKMIKMEQGKPQNELGK